MSENSGRWEGEGAREGGRGGEREGGRGGGKGRAIKWHRGRVGIQPL